MIKLIFVKKSFVQKKAPYGLNFAGLPHGQEKSGKTNKNDKIQENQVKMGFLKKFRKKSGKNSKKHQILSVQIYQIHYI